MTNAHHQYTTKASAYLNELAEVIEKNIIVELGNFKFEGGRIVQVGEIEAEPETDMTVNMTFAEAQAHVRSLRGLSEYLAGYATAIAANEERTAA